MTQKKQYIRRVSQEPQQGDWLPDSIYLIRGNSTGTVEIAVTDADSEPHRLVGSFKGVFGDLSEAPTNKKKNDIIGITTNFGIKLYIYDGTDWKETYDLKEYIDDEVTALQDLITDIEESVDNIEGDKNFIYEQNFPSATWEIAHNLNKKPSVTVVDSANTEVEGQIIINDGTIVLITFNAPFSGTAILN